MIFDPVLSEWGISAWARQTIHPHPPFQTLAEEKKKMSRSICFIPKKSTCCTWKYSDKKIENRPRDGLVFLHYCFAVIFANMDGIVRDGGDNDRLWRECQRWEWCPAFHPTPTMLIGNLGKSSKKKGKKRSGRPLLFCENVDPFCPL